MISLIAITVKSEEFAKFTPHAVRLGLRLKGGIYRVCKCDLVMRNLDRLLAINLDNRRDGPRRRLARTNNNEERFDMYPFLRLNAAAGAYFTFTFKQTTNASRKPYIPAIFIDKISRLQA